MEKGPFWTKSYDEGLTDIDPEMWETTVVELIRPILKEFSDKPAFSFMGVEVTFGELNHYSNRFANMLLSNGLKKGDVVGINLPNIPEYIIAWIGALKAGGVVSGVSPLLSIEEMKHQLKDSDAKVLVTLDAIFAGKLINISSHLPKLEIIVAASVGGFLSTIKRTVGKLLGKIPKGKVTKIEGKRIYTFKDVIRTSLFSADCPHVKLFPDDIAHIQYTGGTTGLPKGAMLNHKNFVSNLIILQNWLGWKKGKGVALSGFPFFHIAGLFFNASCIYFGWTQILIPNPRDTEHICSQLEKYTPNILVNVPSLYQLLIANPRFKTLDHSKVETCLSGASPFPEESQKALENIVGQGKLLEVYGMTETSALITMNPSKRKRKLGSIGLPILNTDVKLIDPTNNKEVPLGEPGEICVKGPQVMTGYYNNPEETQKTIDGDGYLHTGDIAVQDEEGYLRIVDRTKDMIIVSGFKVFSKKVEEFMTEHPAIDMIAMIGLADTDRLGSEIVKAYIILRPDYDFDGNEEKLKEDIIRFAKDKLAPYEVPKIIEFVNELPLTAVGKVDKKQLRKK